MLSPLQSGSAVPHITYPGSSAVRAELWRIGAVLRCKRGVINGADAPERLRQTRRCCALNTSRFPPHRCAVLSSSSGTQQFNLKLWLRHISPHFRSRNELCSLVPLFELCKGFFIFLQRGAPTIVRLLGEATLSLGRIKQVYQTPSCDGQTLAAPALSCGFPAGRH